MMDLVFNHKQLQQQNNRDNYKFITFDKWEQQSFKILKFITLQCYYNIFMDKTKKNIKKSNSMFLYCT